jgi:pyruvate dehydrogenase E2 component (dihydrolipoyllysine-residue acetyltransferase)
MDVLMPQLGETVAEGKITKWFKSAGDAIKPGDNLFEIETDKVSMEVPSTSAGVLAEIRVSEGEVAPVGAIVAVISDGAPARPRASSDALNATASAASAPKAMPAPAPAPASSQSPLLQRMSGMASFVATQPAAAPGAPIKLDPFFEVRTPQRNYGPARLPGGARVTPLARRLASEAGIDLSRVSASGPHGRVVARDVEAAAASAPKPRPPVAAPPHAEGPSAEQVLALYRDVPFEEVPLDAMRRTIATRLIQAKQTIPHFYLTADVEIGRLLKFREEANAAAPKDKDGNPRFKLSVNDFVIKAWAAALQRVPDANAVWAEDRILRFKHCDIGVAVAIDGGLITPVIRQAEMKTLSTISTEMRELAARARARKLTPSEYQGGASAISNLGMYGVREFSAIINPPQATILAIGAARRQAVETDNGGVAFASVMAVTLSCDHRVVDGALGAELIAAFKGLVEQPVSMLM